jgi:tetratricopeptide (TPR) repeat protein
MKNDRYQGSIVAFRNDRMGARFLSILNAIRISNDYNIPYYFTWTTHGRTNAELQAPTDLFDEDYFSEHYVNHEEYRGFHKKAIDLGTLPPDSGPETIERLVAENQVLMSTATHLFVLPWEQHNQVAESFTNAVAKLRFSPAVQAAIAFVDDTLRDKGTAVHIRRGDIIYDPVTSAEPWPNKYIPREFYEVLVEQLRSDPENRILGFSDEPIEISRLKEINSNVVLPSEILPENLTLAQSDFMELYAMSRCQNIYGPPSSGFSMAAAAMGNFTVTDICNGLGPEGKTQALERLTDRLKTHSDIFLSDGDISQSLYFALEYLTENERGDEGQNLLEDYIERGINKPHLYTLWLKQILLSKKPRNSAHVLQSFAKYQPQKAVAGRLDQRWSELYRLASIAAAREGNKPEAAHRIAMSIWYSGGNRPAYNTLGWLLQNGVVDPAQFIIPFDPDLSRIAPTAATATTGDLSHPMSGEGGNLILPPDLMIRDWEPLLGKTQTRGFDTPAVAKHMCGILQRQFSRSSPTASMKSAVGVYSRVSGDLEAAITHQNEALYDVGDNALFHMRLAEALLAKDRANRTAEEHLERAIELAPGQAFFQARLALYLWDQGKREAARDMMTTIAEQHPRTVPELLYYTAHMRRLTKLRDTKTLGYINKALEMAPHMQRYRLLRYHLLVDQDKKDEALAEIDDIAITFGTSNSLVKLRERLE